MNIPIYFIKTKIIKSKSKDATYFLVCYLTVDKLEYKEVFINQDLFEKIKDYDILDNYTAKFELNNYLRPVLVDIF